MWNAQRIVFVRPEAKRQTEREEKINIALRVLGSVDVDLIRLAQDKYQ
jgi:hypothetical protein